MVLGDTLGRAYQLCAGLCGCTFSYRCYLRRNLWVFCWVVGISNLQETAREISGMDAGGVGLRHVINDARSSVYA